jgi:pimeloyl-ACP methyl ester carboxylesterase
MPALVRAAFPWLRLDERHIYAIGSSMGAQEALLLVARGGLRLAGVAALDPVTSMAARYRKWFVTPGERALPAKARVEFGGTPAQVPAAYAARSPGSFVREIAHSGVPVQFWWSHRDAVVTDQATETGAFYRRLLALVPSAPVREIVGYWQHAHEFHPGAQLPAVLACFGLLPASGVTVPAYTLEPGAVDELPPEQHASPVPLSPAFCGPAK